MKTHILQKISKIFMMLTLVLLAVSAYAEGGGDGAAAEATVNGYTYSYYAGIYAGKSAGTPYANSCIVIRTSPLGTVVPGGWMYAQSKLYTHSGALKVTAVEITNSNNSSWLNGNFASLKPADENTLYYGAGRVGFWNGTKYLYYTVNSTPSFQP